MIKQLKYALPEIEVKTLNGDAERIVRDKMSRTLSEDLSQMLTIDKREVEGYTGNKDCIFSSELVVLTLDHWRHIEGLLKIVKMNSTREMQVLIDEIRNEVLNK
jgi:RNA binding exosome subunit